MEASHITSNLRSGKLGTVNEEEEEDDDDDDDDGDSMVKNCRDLVVEGQQRKDRFHKTGY